MKKMIQIPSLSYEDSIIVTWNGTTLVPNDDYVLDEKLNNQLRLIDGHAVKDRDVIQIMAWVNSFQGPTKFERTIIKGSDYIAFHESQAA